VELYFKDLAVTSHEAEHKGEIMPIYVDGLGLQIFILYDITIQPVTEALFLC